MHSHLLLLRVWPETVGNEQVEWRGRIQSLHSGEVRYFRDSQTLHQALLRMIEDLESDLAVEISQGSSNDTSNSQSTIQEQEHYKSDQHRSDQHKSDQQRNKENTE